MQVITNLLQNKKYRKIILISFTVSLLFTAMASFELIYSRRIEVRHAKTQVNNLSHVLEEHLIGAFKKIDLTLLEIVRAVQLQKMTLVLKEREIKNTLSARLNDFPEASVFYITDRNGHDLFREESGKKLFLGDKEDFLNQKSAVNDQLYITKPLLGIYGNYKGTQVVAFSRRIVNKKNEFEGIVAVLVPLTYFKDLYSTLDIGKDGLISLASSENILYARYPWDDKLIGKDGLYQSIITKLFARSSNVFYNLQSSTPDKIPRYTSARRVGDSKFFIMVGVSKNEVLATWKKRALLYLLGFLIYWICGAIYLLNFLTSLQELENRRKLDIQTAKLTSLGEMAAGIGHEINNPLTIISNRCSSLIRKIEREQYTSEDLKTALYKINETVNRIAKIVRGLKSVSRNSENDVLSPVSLKAIMENTLELCHEKFCDQIVSLKVDPIPEVMIECREAQIIQVLLNLLGNAYDAVEHLGERWVHLSFFIREQQLSIIVIDSGKGIPENIYQNMMNPFYTTKEVGKGTGLGLSITKGIIDEHKGKFYLDRESINTKFVLELLLSTR